MTLKKQLIERYRKLKGRGVIVKQIGDDKFVEADFMNWLIDTVIYGEIVRPLGKTLCKLELNDLGDQLKELTGGKVEDKSE